MSIKITLKKDIKDKLVKNYVLFCDENFKINDLKKLPIKKQSSEIIKIIDSEKSNKKNFLLFNINSSQKIILIRIKKNQTSVDNEKIGAKFYDFLKSNTIFDVTLFGSNIQEFSIKNKLFLDEILHGVQLKSYVFKKYKSNNFCSWKR